MACALFGVIDLNAQIFAPEPVQWQDPVKTTATYPGAAGSTLTRTSATSATPGWDGDAISTKWIYGDGWVEFRFDRTDRSMAVGLVEANTDRHWDTFPYAIRAASGTFGFFQGGNQVGPALTAYATTDVFRIERLGTRVTFTRKSSAGTILQQWPTLGVADPNAIPSQGILFVDSSFVHVNGSLSNCKYFGAAGPEDVLWISPVNTTGDYSNGGKGSTISKTAGTNSFWDADAISSKALAGDGVLRFRVGNLSKVGVIGLTVANPDRNYQSISYAISTISSAMTVYESGVVKYSASCTTSDVLSIRRTGTTITYAKNDLVFYTTNNATTDYLFADCSLFTSGAEFTNCQIEGYPLSEGIAVAGSGVSVSYASTGTKLTSASAGGVLTTSLVPGDSTYPNNGTLSFAFGQVTGKNVVCGLTTSRTPVTPTANSISYGIKGRSDGAAEVVESGTTQLVLGTYVTSDRFEVRRVNGMIEYVKNGVVLHSISAPTGSLSGAFAFVESAGVAKDVVWYNGEADLLWRKAVQASADWSTITNGELTRGTAVAGWTSDALGTRQLIGDGYVQWKFANSGKDAMVGLSPSDKGNSHTTLQFAIYGNGSVAGDPLKVYESGINKGTFGIFTVNDTFRIRRTGSTIRYFKIDSAGTETLLYTSLGPFSGPLVVDCALNDPNVAIVNCRIGNGDSDGDRMDDQWEYGEFGNLTQTSTGISGDYDGDGVDNLHEFYNGSNATDAYFTSAPAITLISGDNQFSDPGTFLGQPLVVEVRDPSQAGSPVMPNVPVRFIVQSGGGRLSNQYGGTVLQTMIGAWTDATGRARAYYKQPNSNGVDSIIRAQAGAVTALSNTIDFTSHTNLLRAWWKFDEASGTTALDSAPQPNPPPVILPSHGTITDAVRETSFLDKGGAVPDRSLRFDGIGDFVMVPHLPVGAGASALDFSEATFSVSAWVRLDSGTDLSSETTHYPIVSKWAASPGGFEFAIKGGLTAKGLTFRTMNNGETVQEVNPSLDQRAKLRDAFPHLVTFTRDASNVGRMYIDGEEVGSLANITGSLTTTANLFIAKDSSATTKYYKGVLEDVKVLTTTLRADEIAAAFDADGDGLPDWWEAKYFGNLDGTNNPSSDTDGDGVSDGDEYEQGRNPNAGSVTNSNLELIIFTPTRN